MVGKESGREIKNTGFIAHKVKPNFFFSVATTMLNMRAKA